MGLWFYDFKTKQNCLYKDKSGYRKKPIDSQSLTFHLWQTVLKSLNKDIYTYLKIWITNE